MKKKRPQSTVPERSRDNTAPSSISDGNKKDSVAAAKPHRIFVGPMPAETPDADPDSGQHACQDTDNEAFVSRPWVEVKPTVPHALVAALALIMVAALSLSGYFFLLSPAAPRNQVREEDTLPPSVPELNRHDENVNSAAGEDMAAKDTDPSNAETAFDAADEGAALSEEPALDILIVKVSGSRIRANGKLVNFNELHRLCRSTGETSTIKLIHRGGDPKVLETVLKIFDDNNLNYHFVNN